MGNKLTVIDNFDPFYPASVKKRNTESFINDSKVTFIQGDILDKELLKKIEGRFDGIIHLAAKAGVRPSIKDPVGYYSVNVQGTQNLLEFSRERNIRQFVFGSSSSVYGVNPNFPWREADSELDPISPYAASKIAAELMGKVYSGLYGINFIALRFFTVFGPRQRPDLAIHNFSRKILSGDLINFYGDGSTRRDYTFISDIVDGIVASLDLFSSGFEIINLGNNRPVTLNELLKTLEDVLGSKAVINKMPEQPGDVPVTYADISKAQNLLRYSPRVGLREGMELFKKWLDEQ
jgi:UDP-glucuronate 4-epimerase